MPGLSDFKNTVVSKEKDGGGSPVLFLLKTLLMGYVFTGMLLCLLAFLAYKASLSEKTVALACTVIYILSCLLCGFLAGKSSKKDGFSLECLQGYCILQGYSLCLWLLDRKYLLCPPISLSPLRCAQDAECLGEW